MSATPTDVGQGEPQGMVQPTGQVPGGTPPATGTAGPGAVDLSKYVPKSEFETVQKQVEELRGFQGMFTKYSQAGLRELFEPNAKPEELKSKFAAWKDAEMLVAKFRERGADPAKALEAYDLLYTEPTPGAQPTPTPSPTAVSQGPPPLTREELKAAIANEMTAWQTQAECKEVMNDLVEALGVEAGLGTEQSPLPEAARRMIRGALDAEIQTVTGGARDPVESELLAAAQRVTQTLFVPVRASGAALVGHPNRPNMPPTANARGPGGQVPAPNVRQMTADQRREAARQVVRETLEAAVPVDTGTPPEPLPQGFSFV